MLFAQKMGIEQIDYDSDWELHVPEEWRKQAVDVLEENGVREGNKIIAFQCDSKGLSRQWAKKRQIEFARLVAKKHWKLVMLSDEPKGNLNKYAINLTAKLTIEQYIGIISQSTVFVGVDSSGVHIAGAIGIPAVGLFGSVDPKLRIEHYGTVHPVIGKAKCVFCNDWQKANCNNAKNRPPCLYAITGKEVMKKVEEVLDEYESILPAP